jgi:hypothetical protein
VSGSADRPVVRLLGPIMESLVQAIPETANRTGRRVIVVGGLAVICRLASPYRATSDLDTVNRRGSDEPAQLDLLIASGAARSGPSGALVPTPAGPVQVDVLEVSDSDLENLPEDPTARLHILAHAWAVATATQMELRSESIRGLAVAVAEPGALIAMKLQAVMDRSRQKEATDLLDIIRLTLDPTAGAASREALRQADPILRGDALLHARRWFDQQADRTLRRVHEIPEGRGVAAEDIAFVAELLEDVLLGGGN